MSTASSENVEQREALAIGQIAVGDVDELQYCVAPWQLGMSQQSCGRLQASFDVVQVHGILLTRERWSHRVAATGVSPQGYVAFAGSCGHSSFTWCGYQIVQDKLACAIDATEVDFITSDQEDHWTMLLPLELIAGQTGPEIAADLLDSPGLHTCEPRHVAYLAKLAVQSISLLQADDSFADDSVMLDLLETRLVRVAVACLFSGQRARANEAQATRRFLAFRKALALIDAEQGQVTIEDLVAQTGMSRRSIETGFREALGIPPLRYARQLRLNGMHQELLRATPLALTVTDAMENWGFSELGRAAGYYRRLFGETPSATLRRDGGCHGDRLVDALH